MDTTKLTEFFTNVKEFEHRNRPTILTVLGVAGLWTTAWMAYRAGPQAERILKEKQKDLNDICPGDKKAKQTVIFESVKELTPVILPPLVMGGLSTACIIGSHKASSNRIATLSAAYTVADATLHEFKGKMTELMGERKVQQVQEAVSHDRVERDPPPADGSQVIITGNGDVLCYDEYSGRYFYSNAEKIGEAIIKLSYDIQSESWISLNDFYYEIGLPSIRLGDELGWSINDTDRGRLPITYVATMSEDRRPCLAVHFEVSVRYIGAGR